MSKAEKDLGEYGPTPPGTPDANGTPFDPAKHQKYAGGRAMKNRKTGEWVQKGGRGNKKPAPSDPAAVDERDLMREAVKNSPKAIPDAPPALEPLPAGAAPIDGVEEAAAAPVAPGIPGGPIDPNAAQLDATCRTAIVMAEGLCIMALGPDMKHTDDERTALLESWKLFLAEKDGVRLPPWAALVAGYVAIAAARADKPTFQARCAAWGARFKKWFSK